MVSHHFIFLIVCLLLLKNLEDYILKSQYFFLPQNRIINEEGVYLPFHRREGKHFDFIFSNAILQSNQLRYHVDQIILLFHH